MLKQIGPALRMTILMTILTGLLYPGAITGVCQLLFRDQANGALLSRNQEIIGSPLIGQNFAKPEYFHPRPSAAGNDGYDPTASGGSNLGPVSQKLFDRMKTAAERFRKENPDYSGPIPADALTASGSGLDPDISPANAAVQAARIAKTRQISLAAVERLIQANTRQRDLGFLGEPRVNVLETNLALDRRFPLHAN